MPVLLAIFGAIAAIIKSIGAVYAVILGTKLGLLAAWLTAYLAITGTFLLAITGLVTQVGIQQLDPQYYALFGIIMPGNFWTLVSVLLSAKSIQVIYIFNASLIHQMRLL